MLPDRVSNPEPLTYESGALPIALRGPKFIPKYLYFKVTFPVQDDLLWDIQFEVHWIEINILTVTNGYKRLQMASK